MHTKGAHRTDPAYVARDAQACTQSQDWNILAYRGSELAGGASTHTLHLPSLTNTEAHFHDPRIAQVIGATRQHYNMLSSHHQCPGETLPASQSAMQIFTAQHTYVAEQTSTRVEHSRSVSDAHQTEDHRSLTRRKSCDLRTSEIHLGQRQRHNLHRQSARTCSSTSYPVLGREWQTNTCATHTICSQGNTTQRVTILFDRRITSQCANPREQQWVLDYS